MAKKVVVKDDELVDEKKPKKKKHVCCGCCIAILVFFLIVVAAGVGVGWYFGDKLTREYLDMSLGETLGVVGDLYWADDKKVVKNPYTDADRESFYKELKRNIMLKEDVNVDFDGALEKAVVKFMEQAGKGGAAESARALNEGENIGEGGDTDNGDNGDNGESGGNDIMNIFADMIVEVLNSDNIDKARLEAYDENDPSTDTYIFNIKDRELAAFIGSLFNIVLKNADKMDELKDISEMGLDLSSVASLKQITFKATKKDGEVVKATRADITLWLGLQDAAGQALTTILTNQGYGWASSLAKSLANTLLPKNLYVNVGIPLFGDAEPVVSLNDMTDADRERAYKLVNGVLKATSEGGGEPMTVDSLLANVTESIKPVLEQAAETFDFSKVDEGAVKIDLLDIAAKTASESFEDPLTKADFLYLLQAVYSDPELQLDALEPYRYTNRYLVDGKDVYIKGGDPDKTPIDYEREFIKEIENKYALKFKDGAKLNDVLAMLGVSLDGSSSGEMGSTDLLDMIDAQKFNSLLDRNINDIKLNVTDRMLASALSGQLDGLLTGGESDFSGMTVTLDALTFVKKEEKPKNMYAMLAVEADLSGLFGSFGDDELVTRLATGLMPDKLLLTVTVDITQNREAGTSAEPVEFLLNSCANTDRALSVLEKLAPSLNLKSMSEQIDDMLNGMLDQMYKVLDIVLVPSAAVKTDGVWTGNTGALVLPDIFTFVTDTVLVDESGESVVTADELKNVLRELNDTDGVVVTPGIAENYAGFIADVVDKYYLNPAEGDDLTTFAGLTSFMSDFDTDKFRVTGTDPAVKYLVHDTRSASELEPVMTGAELGALIKEQMGAGVQDYNVKRVSTGDGSLSVVLAIDVGNLLPEDVKFLVTAQELFVTATVDMSVVRGEGTDTEPYRYDVSVKLNDMDKDTYESALKIIRFFTADFDIATQVDEFGEILYTQMQNINAGFAPSVENGDAPAPSADFFRFTERGLVMSDFYTFLANKMGLTLDGDTTADTVKNVVQGMYARSSVAELSNPNNYVYGEIVTNPGDSQWADGDYPHSGKNYSDKAFNAYLSQGVGQLGSVGIVQTTVLSAADAANTKARAIRDWLSARVEIALDDTSDYLAITVQMDMGDFMTGNDKSGGFLPSSVIATIVYKYGVTGEFENAGIIFNDMTYNEYVVMQQLMGLSPDSTDPNKVNINTVENKTVEVLDALTAVMNVTLLPQVDGEGVGGVCAVLKSFGG